MQIGSRFTEYGLTGGFFWICQLILLTYSSQAKILLSNLSSMKLDIPAWMSPSFLPLSVPSLLSRCLWQGYCSIYLRCTSEGGR